LETILREFINLQNAQTQGMHGNPEENDCKDTMGVGTSGVGSLPDSPMVPASEVSTLDSPKEFTQTMTPPDAKIPTGGVSGNSSNPKCAPSLGAMICVSKIDSLKSLRRVRDAK